MPNFSRLLFTTSSCHEPTDEVYLIIVKTDMKKKFCFCLFSFIKYCAQRHFGRWNANGSIGARAKSLGSAYVGLANDCNAINWNPAGLTSLPSQSFSFYCTVAVSPGTYKLDIYNPHQCSFNLDNAKIKKDLINFSRSLVYFRPVNDEFVVGFDI